MAGEGELDRGEEEIGSARAPQIDVGTKPWRLYTADFENGARFARVLAIGKSAVGAYQADTEYWYVTTANLQYLGQHGLKFSHTDGSGTPPALSGSQEFDVPRVVTWKSFLNDPVSGGHRYDGGNVHLRIGADEGGVARLTWYQTVPTGRTAANVTPSGAFTAGSGALQVPSGEKGYAIDCAIE